MKLAEGGVDATVFDASHPREKPCGGGLTGKALRELPDGPVDDPLPARRVASCRFEAEGDAVEVPLREPVAIASRRELDAWLLRRATAAGARHVAERVVEVARGEVRTAASGRQAFDLVVGADGAGSLVRRTFLGPLPKERLDDGRWAGTPRAPRPCSSASRRRSRATSGPSRARTTWASASAPRWGRCRRALSGSVSSARWRGRCRPCGTPRPSATPTRSRPRRSTRATSWRRRETASRSWGTPRPWPTRSPARGSSTRCARRPLLAETLLAEGSPARYPERVLEDFGRDLLKAAALQRRFYAPGFAGRMVRYAARSHAIRDVLGDLVLGQQGYVGLKRRLLWTLPRFLVEAAWSGVTTPRAVTQRAGGELPLDPPAQEREPRRRSPLPARSRAGSRTRR